MTKYNYMTLEYKLKELANNSLYDIAQEIIDLEDKVEGLEDALEEANGIILDLQRESK